MELDRNIVKKVTYYIKNHVETFNTLPIYSEHCYFCNVNGRDCGNCEYGSVHGICGDYKSVWRAIKNGEMELNRLDNRCIKNTKFIYLDSLVKNLCNDMELAEDINSLMKIKTDLLIQLVDSFYQYDEKCEKLIDYIKENYWKYDEDNFIAFGDRIRITTNVDTYNLILARVSTNIVSLICLDDGNRWTEMATCSIKNDVYRHKDGISKDEFFEKMAGYDRSNRKFEFIKWGEK